MAACSGSCSPLKVDQRPLAVMCFLSGKKLAKCAKELERPLDQRCYCNDRKEHWQEHTMHRI